MFIPIPIQQFSKQMDQLFLISLFLNELIVSNYLSRLQRLMID
jgi:hypothetical protein